MKRLLVLDGNQRSALAATRALGKRGIWVVVGGGPPGSLAAASRYCRESFPCPPPAEDGRRFVNAVKREVERRRISVVYPMTDESTMRLLPARDELAAAGCEVAAGDGEAYDVLSDKWRLAELAKELGIEYPETHPVSSIGGAKEAAESLGYPVVLKPRRSATAWGSQIVRNSAHLVRVASDIEKAVKSNPSLLRSGLLVQRYVAGEGQGLSVLRGHGGVVAAFAHRRVREKPPWGGVSVLSESIPVAIQQRAWAEALLKRAGWQGVAMIEFKVPRTGAPVLMEVNARFWGSVQLAIDAGIDFPYLLYRVVAGETVPQVTTYRVGVRSRWLLGDLDRLYLAMKRREPGHRNGHGRWRAVLEFLSLWQRHTRYDVNRFDDLAPFLVEIRRYVSSLLSRGERGGEARRVVGDELVDER